MCESFKNRFSIGVYRILPIICITVTLFAIEPPKDPIPPVIESIEKKTEISKKDSKKEKNLKTIAVTVKLCDGRQVSGNIEYEKEELFIQHLKDGIKYDKKMQITDIKQIKILSWELKKGKKVKDGTTYQTSPLRVQITNLSGENYLVKGLKDTEFLDLKVTNQNGIAKLFSFWLDLQYDNGSWYSKLGLTTGSEREDCFADVIRIIQFN